MNAPKLAGVYVNPQNHLFNVIYVSKAPTDPFVIRFSYIDENGNLAVHNLTTGELTADSNTNVFVVPVPFAGVIISVLVNSAGNATDKNLFVSLEINQNQGDRAYYNFLSGYCGFSANTVEKKLFWEYGNRTAEPFVGVA